MTGGMTVVAKLRSGTLLAAALGFCADTAQASERHGWYFGLDAGASLVNEMEIESTPNTYSFDAGLAVLGVAGYQFKEPALRLEFEAGFRDNNIDDLGALAAPAGEVREISGFANLLWAPTSSESNWSFAIGAGLGVDNVRFKDHVGIDSRDTVPAAQGIIGLNYRLNDHWDYALTYRVLFADVGEYDTTVGLGVVSGESDIVKHAFTLGFRYDYDDPPPPPAPAPPPPPPPPPPPMAKQFVIFFGFNKCNITAEADAALSEAAAAAKSSGSASVRIVGHTDSVGSADSNQRLSECRAGAAKANLAGKGVAEGAISTNGKGESELMVQTGDGVKEPQNRRATIDLN